MSLSGHEPVRRADLVQLHEDARVERLHAGLAGQAASRGGRRDGDERDEDRDDEETPGGHPDKIGISGLCHILQKDEISGASDLGLGGGWTHRCKW